MIVFVTVFTPIRPKATLLFGPPTMTHEGSEVEVDGHVEEVEMVTVVVCSGDRIAHNTPGCCRAWFAATEGL